MEKKYDVFLSYRRATGSERAELLRAILEQRGYVVFMDTHELKSGHFKEEIQMAIESASNVVVLITSGCFDHVKENDTWVFEISEALRLEKVVIPIFFDGIKTIEGINLPEALLTLPSHNAISYVHEYANAAYDKLCQFLGNPTNKPDKKHSKHIEHQQKSIGNNKRKLFIVFALLLVVAGLSAVFLNHPTSSFSYLKNGLTVQNVKGLTEEQSAVLEELLNQMVKVKGGTFLMGNFDRLEAEGLFVAEDELSRVAHNVELSDYYISKYELTQKQWKAFMDLSQVAHDFGAQKPVDYLSWNDCSTFACMLSDLTGLSFSLPTEAQWEFAARGGLSGVERELIYSGSDDPFVVGWIFVSPDSTHLHNVGQKTGNEIGLFDMTGNVAEWCKDYYGPYTENEQVNPQGPSEGELRVIRGGDYQSSLRICKVTTRQQWFPDMQREATGMRLVINIDK